MSQVDYITPSIIDLTHLPDRLPEDYEENEVTLFKVSNEGVIIEEKTVKVKRSALDDTESSESLPAFDSLPPFSSQLPHRPMPADYSQVSQLEGSLSDEEPNVPEDETTQAVEVEQSEEDVSTMESGERLHKEVVHFEFEGCVHKFELTVRMKESTKFARMGCGDWVVSGVLSANLTPTEASGPREEEGQLPEPAEIIYDTQKTKRRKVLAFHKSK